MLRGRLHTPVIVVVTGFQMRATCKLSEVRPLGRRASKSISTVRCRFVHNVLRMASPMPRGGGKTEAEAGVMQKGRTSIFCCGCGLSSAGTFVVSTDCHPAHFCQSCASPRRVSSNRGAFRRPFGKRSNVAILSAVPVSRGLQPLQPEVCKAGVKHGYRL
jgi:hypothetical protein